MSDAHTLIGGGALRGYDWAIINRSTHPCCYARIPAGSWVYDQYVRHRQRINESVFLDKVVSVHGGVTFVSRRETPNVDDADLPSGLWIGWDCAHYGDYTTFGLHHFGEHRHAYTSDELLRDVLDCIQDLVEAEIRQDVKPED